MVYFPYSISVCNSVDQPTAMASSVKSPDPGSKSRNRKTNLSSTCSKFPVCHRSRSAAIDVAILIAVLVACGGLLFPYMKIITIESLDIFAAILCLIGEEISHSPLIYGSIGVSIFCATLAACVVLVFTSRKCGNPYCKGLRKAAEFDIQLETEECVKNSTPLIRNGVKKGLFELPRDHHRELEAELKKMAPPNGRAVLIFRARCGCSVGRLEVPGRRKQLRKIKK